MSCIRPSVRVQPIDALTLSFGLDMPEQIGVFLTPTRAVAAGTVRVRWRLTSGGPWSGWIRALRVDPTVTATTGAPADVVDRFAVAIRRLSFSTSYTLEFEHVETGQPTKYLTVVRTTISPHPASGATTRTATTANIATQLSACVAGDVLTLQPGTYSALSVSVPGTTASPVVIRGTSFSNTIISRGTVGAIVTLTSGNVIFENLTFQGTGVDAGISLPSSMGVLVVGSQARVTVRNCFFSGTDQGVVSDDGQTQMHVYNNVFRGNNRWTSAFVDSNLTWNDDAIRIPGEGNCAWNNTIYGYGDATAVVAGVDNKWNFFYRNYIPMTGDDMCEADYSRCGGFYDNYGTNCATLLSVDTVYGGPFYCDRNICVNPFRGPLKLNGGDDFKATGALIHYNTFAKTNGVASVANFTYAQYGNSNGLTVENVSFLGNIFVNRGSASSATLWMDQVANDHIDWDYNAMTDGPVHWGAGTSYANMALAIAGAGQVATTPVMDGVGTRRHANDKVATSNPWAQSITLGSDYQTQFTGQPSFALASGSNLRNCGIVIPGVTDGFSGGLPDLGAVIGGQTQPIYGADWDPALPASARSDAIIIPSPARAPFIHTEPKTARPLYMAAAGFTPSYSIPTTVNTSTAVGTNSLLSVAPSPYSPANPDAWYNACISGFAGAVYCPLLTVGGAHVYSGTGGHFDGSLFGKVYFDYTDATWKYASSGNGVAETGGSINISSTSGYPYYEITGSSGQPAAAHTYLTQIHLPVGSKGTLLRMTAGGVCFESVLSPAVHKEDLNTRVWSRVTNDTTRSDGETQATDGIGNGFEFSAHYDPVAGRVYLLAFGNISNMPRMKYLRLSDNTIQTTADFTGNQAPTISEFFYPQGWIYPEGRMLMHYCGVGGSLMGLDLTNDTTITSGWKVLSQTGPQPAHGAKPTWHPVNGKFYYTAGDGVLSSLTPPAGSGMSGTWTWATITVGGAGFPARTAANGHYSNLSYIEALGMLAWLQGVAAGNTYIVKV